MNTNREQPVPLILASVSPRRKGILKTLGLAFIVMPSSALEDCDAKEPAEIVKTLALRKARAILPGVKRGVIVSADTIVVVDNEIIGKPKDYRDAVRILRKLNGSVHKVYTGVAVIEKPGGCVQTGVEVTKVKMRMFTDAEVLKLARKNRDKAGAYAIQETDDKFVEYIRGDYYNVVGLPKKMLVRMLNNTILNVPIKTRGL
ncbi:MAG: nucleoside triphosphate pyrophosphatase [Elusimicrobiota bacterium]